MDQPQERKPALTVIIQSWWTPALAVLMLVVGLLAGYFGRPLVNKNGQTPVVVATATTPSNTELMDYLVANTSHFEGDPNAAVTLIEFSDYQ